MGKLAWIIMGVAATGLAGCGSGSGGRASCGKVAACGGDIVADWTIVDACLTASGMALFGDFCPAAHVDATGLTASGMAAYRADMTFSANITLAGSIALVLPGECLTMGGVTATCAQLDQGFQNELAMNPDPTIQSISCTGSGSCRCTIQMAPRTGTGSGTYSTAGTNLIENGAVSGHYCVQGDELHLLTASMDMGTFVLTGDIVLTK
jgi:hypothetical protein